MQHFIKCVCLVLCMSMMAGVVGCTTNPSVTPSDTDTKPPVSDTDPVEPDTTPGTEDDTSAPATSEPDTSAPDTAGELDTSAPDTTEPDTTPEPEIPEEPPITHPLTGLVAETDLSTKRPIAVMINNLRASTPQEGIQHADVIYECLVEGGITRLMMISLDYGNLPEFGSIRSARDYYLNFAADYDAVFVHGGGSPFAYESIKDRKIQNLDGVNMWDVEDTYFYRSKERMKKMSYEHCLMTTGELIEAAIKYKKYRTELTEGFDYPLDFVAPDETVTYADIAEHIHIPFSISQVTDFEYDKETGEYLRYQFNGEKHVIGATGEQLSFKNVMILFCKTGAITGDPKYRIDVDTVGEGSGYYAVNGTYTKIRWVKESDESPIHFYNMDGEPLLMNPGKTFVSVCPTSIESIVSMNYKK